MRGSDPVRKKKSYSLIYRIFRRLRYVRYLKRKRKTLIRQANLEKKREQKLMKENLKEHVRQIREEERNKLKFERDRQRQEQIEMRQSLKREPRAVFSFRPSDIYRSLSDNRAAVVQFVRIAVQSTIIFLISYFALYLLSQAATLVAARIFHYPTIVYYWEIYFNISVEDWFHDSVKTIYSSGPIIALITGISFMLIYHSRKEFIGLFKLFFLWGFLHGMSMFFGAMLVGTLFESGIGHVISWMYVMDTGKVLYSILSIFMLALVGMVSIKPFLISGNTYFNEMTRVNRRAFMWAQVFVPFLIGSVFLIALRTPRFMFYETFITLTLIIPLLPLMAAYPAYNDLFFDEEKREGSYDWKFFLILVAIVLFYRGILNFGISFPG